MDKKEYNRNWREKNAERDNERKRKWREKNAEHVKEYDLKWRAEHPEYVERQRQYKQDRYHNDPEYRQEHNEYVLKWKAEHPEYVERHLQYKQDKYHNDPAYRGYCLFHSYKRLDIKKNVAPADPSEYPTLEEVNEMLLQPCVWCGETDWHKIGLDRKDNSKGHIRGNLQPCCKRCNDKKEKRSNEEFRQAIAEGRIKLKAVKTVKADADTAAIPAMPTMRSLLLI